MAQDPRAASMAAGHKATLPLPFPLPGKQQPLQVPSQTMAFMQATGAAPRPVLSSSVAAAAPPPPPSMAPPAAAPTTTTTTASTSSDAKTGEGLTIRALRHLEKPNAPEFVLKKPGGKTFTTEALQNMVLDAAWLETKVQAEKYALAKSRKKQPRKLTRLRYDAEQLAKHYQISKRRLREILRESREGRRKPLKKRGRPRKVKPGEQAENAGAAVAEPTSSLSMNPLMNPSQAVAVSSSSSLPKSVPKRKIDESMEDAKRVKMM